MTISLRGKAKGKTWAARAISTKFRNAVTTRMRWQGRMLLCSAGAKSACPAGTYTLTLKLTGMYKLKTVQFPTLISLHSGF